MLKLIVACMLTLCMHASNAPIHDIDGAWYEHELYLESEVPYYEMFQI